jgi:hypothetical protein
MCQLLEAEILGDAAGAGAGDGGSSAEESRSCLDGFAMDADGCFFRVLSIQPVCCSRKPGSAVCVLRSGPCSWSSNTTSQSMLLRTNLFTSSAETRKTWVMTEPTSGPIAAVDDGSRGLDQVAWLSCVAAARPVSPHATNCPFGEAFERACTLAVF